MTNACIILVCVVLTLQVLLYRLRVMLTPRLATQWFKAAPFLVSDMRGRPFVVVVFLISDMLASLSYTMRGRPFVVVEL